MILERDHYQCQCWMVDWRTGVKRRCLYPANEVDHIRRAVDGEPDDDSPENLQSLCSYHHKMKTARESGEARRVNRRRREVEEWYAHPAFMPRA